MSITACFTARLPFPGRPICPLTAFFSPVIPCFRINIEDSIQAIQSGVTDKYKLFIVTDTIAGAVKIAQAAHLNQINLGGTKSAPDKKKLSKAIYVTEEEEALLRLCLRENIELEIQMIPSEKKINAQTIL